MSDASFGHRAARSVESKDADGAGPTSAAAMIDWEGFYASFRRSDFIPGYEILNHLGGGAFGEVYKARKTSIGKPYAIKFLKLTDPAQREAVERELDQVRLFAAIDHPNLVTIEDMGVAMNVPFLIMGYAGEDTLAKRLKRRDLDREAALRFFVQTCRGVLALHDRRLAHFDLKPSNIFLKGDVARVGDYGLSKLLVEGRQTLSFGRGTPHYMAPEMLKNRADHRADLYALGVILYESLTFALPFQSASQVGLIVREDDEPPAFPADFPAELVPIVTRCLRLDPEKRFGTVAALIEALGQTARPGDSVRFDLAPGSAERSSLTGGAGLPRLAQPGRTRDDLREAAAELARGAVGVARGVIDGVVGSVSSSPSKGALAETRPPGSGEVVVFQTLDDPDEVDARSLPAVRSVETPAPRPASQRNVEPLARFGAEWGSDASVGTIPVPPREEGGTVGTLLASFTLGAEVLGALVTGPALAVARESGKVVDRVLRGVGGLFGGVLRFGLFNVMLFVLGGASAAALLLLLRSLSG